MYFIELSSTYLNELAKQLAFIGSFLGGFSITLLATLILSDKQGKLMNALIISSAFSALSFIVSVIAMTSIIMVTSTDYPLEVNQNNLLPARLVGILTFYVGILSLMMAVSLSGWVRSKRIGWITTTLGVLTIIAVSIFS